MQHDDLNAELQDAVAELQDDFPRLAGSVERARRVLFDPAPPGRESAPDVFDEDPATGQLVLSLGEACYA